jgi:hypothetical protein
MSKWWGIRHIRYWWHRRQVYRWAEECATMGLGLGEPNPSDIAYLNGIWNGEK